MPPQVTALMARRPFKVATVALAKVGKSDFLISLLVHAAAGAPFLRFTAPRPLRVFYLQAEIQYHYLRERLQQLRLDPTILACARDTLVVTPKLRMLLDTQGVALVATAIRQAFSDAPPDILCIDPIRNLFDGGPAGEGENDNAAMLFFLQSRVEAEGPCLRLGQVPEPDRRHGVEAQRLGGQDAAVAGDQHTGIVHQHRDVKAELGDRGGELRHLRLRVRPGVRRIGRERGHRHHLDAKGQAASAMASTRAAATAS